MDGIRAAAVRKLWAMIDDTAKCFLKPEGPVKGLYFSHPVSLQCTQHMCQISCLRFDSRTAHQRDMTESRQWEVGLKFEKQKHFKQNQNGLPASIQYPFIERVSS